ncbi:MAG: bifunctional 4-hydroxy-3-methylbut-2-enyl diphosphate reductase/30S ribosomal protein S1 [Clostridia bacterium]|nr:bifunctional 4-hydroxy-3-methylbut-2-enyl diphosphate reductase/30S ribosomal protein S1 [Clostridia bacterium]
MRIITAKNMGFCFGVRRAVEMSLEAAKKHGTVCSLGELIHNRDVVAELEKQGVRPISTLRELPEGGVLIIRSHGVAPQIIRECEKRGVVYVDCTCPFVEKIHSIVSRAHESGRTVVIAGRPEHPECVGINGCCGGGGVFVGSAEELRQKEGALRGKRLTLVSQTTFDLNGFIGIAEEFARLFPEGEVHNTVCPTTRERQTEAAELASKCDMVLVLGDRHSSNTRKLAEICEMHCKNVKRIANISEIPIDISAGNGIILGVVAGASAPDSLIREVITRMSEMDKANVENCIAENTETVTEAAEAAETVAETAAETVAEAANEAAETVAEVTETAAPAEAAAEEPVVEEGETNFEEALEKTLVRIRNGQILTGTVLSIMEGGVVGVSVGYKADGFIPRDEFSSDPDVDPADVVNVGDKIEVEVLKVNDGEGNVLLSRKNVESKKVWEQFSADAESEGKVVEAVGKKVVKGGLIADINGIEAFIPASQVAPRYIEKLDEFVGQTMKVKILEVDKQRKRVVASRKAVILAEAEEAKRQKWAQLEVGAKVKGTVRRLTDFGAFVDIGGIDGLVHVTDAAWGRVKNVNEVLKVGQEIEVLIMNVDPEKQRVSLGYKQLQPKPWTMAAEKYPVGSIVEGKVVRIVTFGAFVALEPTIDGLIHISQVGARRVTKVEDELHVGDIVRCKVLEVNPEQRRISLSRREVILEENPEIAEEIAREREERSRERAERRAQEEQNRQQQNQQREERRRERSERSGERPERRRREDADYELPPVQSSTTSLANLFGGLSGIATEEENN